MRNSSGIIALTMVFATGGAVPSMAGVLDFDFGTIGADGGAVCGGECVIAGKTGHDFSIGANTVVATGYSNASLGTVKFVIQKPGPFGAETGLGESDTHPKTSDPDYEIGPNKVLVADNAGVHGTPLSVSIGSLQGPDTVDVFTGPTLGSLTLLAKLTGHPDVQTLSLPSDATFVELVGVPMRGVKEASNNTTLIEEAFTVAAPEPAGLALVGTGLFGLGLIRRRRA